MVCGVIWLVCGVFFCWCVGYFGGVSGYLGGVRGLNNDLVYWRLSGRQWGKSGAQV